MGYEGPPFYDRDAVFQAYLQRRHRVDNPNDTLEKPIILELLGDVAGLDVLDLGCGDAAWHSELLEKGARSYVGVDGSENMVARARSNVGNRATIEHSNLQHWAYPENKFDRVTARLVFHYLPDLIPLFQNMHRTLRPGGQLAFSVEHPVITSFDRPGTGVREDWTVDRYFETGARVTRWLGADVVKYHRTIEDHFSALQATGFEVVALRESRPVEQNFVEPATFERRKRIPLFLFFGARRPV